MEEPPRVQLNRRRAKAQLSCNQCRQRKLGCDRKLPCGTCSARGLSSSCTYPPGNTARPADPSSVTPATIQGRLNQLETLVVNLVSNIYGGDGEILTQVPPFPPRHGSIGPTPPASTADFMATETSSPPMIIPPEAGTMHQSPTSTSYIDSSHWIAVLDGIDELKALFDVQGENPQQRIPSVSSNPLSPNELRKSWTNKPELIYGSHASVSIEHLLAALPERRVADRLVFAYFNDMNLAFEFLHRETFIRQYRNFWENTAQVSPMWLGLLFAIMCLASQIQSNLTPADDANSAPSETPSFLPQVIQCLALGDYANGGPYCMEAVFLYFMIEFTRSPDAEAGNWLLTGMLLRLALRMGYHRDPSHFPNISAFQGEMRRRLWATLYSVDVVLSLQMGVPRMIRDDMWDTKPPSNLFDTEISEDMTEVPPSHPDTVLCPVVHLIMKQRLFIVIGKISDWVMDPTATPVDSEMQRIRLEGLLQSTYASFPESLKFTSLDECLADDPRGILVRLSTTLLFLKGLIILNKHFVKMEFSEPPPTSPESARETSTSTGLDKCIDAALNLLEYQQILDTETKPGGVLYSVRWRSSSTISHEFLMATVVLSTFLLGFVARNPQTARHSKLSQIELSLRRCHGVWIKESAASREAKTASRVLGILFERLDMSRDENIAANGGEENYLNLIDDWQEMDFGNV